MFSATILEIALPLQSQSAFVGTSLLCDTFFFSFSQELLEELSSEENQGIKGLILPIPRSYNGDPMFLSWSVRHLYRADKSS